MNKKVEDIVNINLTENQMLSNSATQIMSEEVVDRTGLLGYYFKGKDFNNLITFAPTRENTLIYDQETANLLLDKSQQAYESIRWVGYVKSEETGDFTFKLSDDEQAMIEVGGKIVSVRGKEKQIIHLEKGQLARIKIEYQPAHQVQVDNKVFQNLKLYKMDTQNNLIPMQQNDFRNPDFNSEETRSFVTKASKTNLFNGKVRSDDDEELDTDGDGIPDVWEINGYTIQKKLAVKWDDSFASQGYTKFVSNPYEAHTVGDPYTDYEKAARDIDLSNGKETLNPLVAAFPNVNVRLEKIILSKNEDLSNSVGSNSSNNWTYSNAEGASIEAGANMFGPHFGVSANYQHSETVGTEWGHSTEDTSHINAAETAYLNANVRYNNVGTGSIYNVKPTTSFVLDGTTIGTITAKENTKALSITPGTSYPEKGKNGIAINTMDDFNSRPIPLNKQQLNDFLKNRPIMLETDQVDGEFKVKNIHGAIVTGGEWNGVTQQIEEKTASIIVHDGESISEKRIAAKNYSNPEDKTPSLTLKEALKLAYPEEITEINKLLYYNDRPIYESSIMAYVDTNTATEVKKQLNDTTGIFKDVKYLYDVKLTPKMKFTVKVATLHDRSETYKAGTNATEHTGPLGTWYSTWIQNKEGVSHIGKQYFVSYQKAELKMSKEAKNKLRNDCLYYISLYMKSHDHNKDATIEVTTEKGKAINKKMKLSNQSYQRVDIQVNNAAGDPIDKISIKGDGATNIYWDDITFTEIVAVEGKQSTLPPLPPGVVFKTDFQDDLNAWSSASATIKSEQGKKYAQMSNHGFLNKDQLGLEDNTQYRLTFTARGKWDAFCSIVGMGKTKIIDNKIGSIINAEKFTIDFSTSNTNTDKIAIFFTASGAGHLRIGEVILEKID